MEATPPTTVHDSLPGALTSLSVADPFRKGTIPYSGPKRTAPNELLWERARAAERRGPNPVPSSGSTYPSGAQPRTASMFLRYSVSICLGARRMYASA